MTFLLSVHPVDRHGTTHVSGSSREGSGPDRRSLRRMSRRHASLVLTHSPRDTCQSRSGDGPGHSFISAR